MPQSKAPTNPVSVKWSGLTEVGSLAANHATSGRSTGMTHDVLSRESIGVPGWEDEQGLIISAGPLDHSGSGGWRHASREAAE
jgi:hypothetical protein